MFQGVWEVSRRGHPRSGCPQWVGDRGRCTLVLVRCSEGESQKRASVWGRGLRC